MTLALIFGFSMRPEVSVALAIAHRQKRFWQPCASEHQWRFTKRLARNFYIGNEIQPIGCPVQEQLKKVCPGVMRAPTDEHHGDRRGVHCMGYHPFSR